MSVFSKLRMSKKAAKEHQAKAAEKDKDAVVITPYKHVPTHAAVDALSGAPSSWKAEDRPKIRDHHQRRSQMAISRTGSYLSTVSYMNSAAGSSSSSAPPLPRNSSYSTYNPTWFDRTGDMQGSIEPPQKRYRRGHSYHDSGIGPSPLASNVHSEAVSPVVSPATSPVVSSGNSTTSSSSDPLEMRSHSGRRSIRRGPPAVVYAEKDIFERLHTSSTRKLGEAPISTTGPVPIQKPIVAIVAQEQQPKKQRWSLRGKRNTATLVA